MMGTVRGASGQIRIGNQVAAELGDWTMVKTGPGTKEVTARCVSVQAWLMAQEPDVLALHLGSREWRWRTAIQEVGDGTIRAVVTGAPREMAR